MSMYILDKVHKGPIEYTRGDIGKTREEPGGTHRPSTDIDGKKTSHL